MTDDVTRWMLTVMFTASGVCFGARAGWALRPARAQSARRAVEPFAHCLHMVMGAAMVAMLWHWGAAVPMLAYVVVFTGASVWFAAIALRASNPGAAPIGGSGRGSTASWYEAAMMASMVWMAVAMAAVPHSVTSRSPSTLSTAVTSTPQAVHTHPASSMVMSGGSMPTGTLPAWITLPSLSLALAFGLAALWQAITSVRLASTRPLPRWPAAAAGTGSLMAAGMAITFAQLV